MAESIAGRNYQKIDTGDFHEIQRESGDEYISPIRGKELKYDKGFSSDGDIYGVWTEPGEEAKRAIEMGLPKVVHGNPLGCGCGEAYLHGVGDIIDGQIECDYMCSSGWHNFIVLAMRQQTPQSERQVKVDKFGNLIDDVNTEVKELEEF